MNPITCFPIIIVERFPAGSATARAQGSVTGRFEVPRKAASQIRFERQRLTVTVIDDIAAWRRDQRVAYLFDLTVAFATMVEFSEESVTFEGVEQVDHALTNRPVRVTLAAAGSGY